MYDLVGGIEGDYDPQSQRFSLSGTTEDGERVAISICVPNETHFLLWIASTLHEKQNATLGGKSVEKALIADRMGVGITSNLGSDPAALFKFGIGGFEVSLAVPVKTKSPQRLEAIKAHLKEAVSEMANSKPVKRL